MALYRHMCVTHPHNKPYSCHDYGAKHNNLKELSSHHSNVHRSSTVSYSQCNYSCISKAKMQQHICQHTTGCLCQKYGKGFPMLTELLCYEHLHDVREVFDCNICGVEYYTVAVGYCYQRCGLRFDTLSQRICHKKNCT